MCNWENSVCNKSWVCLTNRTTFNKYLFWCVTGEIMFAIKVESVWQIEKNG